MPSSRQTIGRAVARPLLLAALALVAVLLWDSRRDGPDFGPYFEWARAAAAGDIFELTGEVLSRGGVPFSLASAAPGMLFAATDHIARGSMELRTAAYLTGWLAALLFWVSAFVALRAVARGHLTFVVFGAGALFVGTQAGFYSHVYSAEVFAAAGVAAMWAIALTAGQRGVFASAAAGACAGLLLFVRPYLVFYAVAPLWLLIFRDSAGARRTLVRRLVLLLAAALPLAVAALESGVVNRWMTGSPFRPPYIYGGFGFQSVDPLHPQIGVVLTHPWRGLLTYHPLYGIAFIALIIHTLRDGSRRLLWASTVGVVLLHVWIQSTWHIWWLGSSFGMRGLVPAAMPLVVALVATAAEDFDRQRRSALWWVRAGVIGCAWSFSLLLQEPSPFLTWSQLLAGQRFVAVATGALVLLWIALAVCRHRWRVPEPRVEIACSGIVLVALGVGYLFAQTDGRLSMKLIVVAMVLAAGVWLLERRPRWNPAGLALAWAALAVLFADQALLFGRLATHVERYLASGDSPPRHFQAVATVPLEALRQNYIEYTNIPGFDDRKRKLRAYLNWLEIDGAQMSAGDRDLSERVLRAISDDPVTGDIFVRVTASRGTVYLASADTNSSHRDRVVKVAGAVPGVVGVEADLK